MDGEVNPRIVRCTQRGTESFFGRMLVTCPLPYSKDTPYVPTVFPTVRAGDCPYPRVV